MGSNPSDHDYCADDCPVDRVSWNDIAAGEVSARFYLSDASATLSRLYAAEGRSAEARAVVREADRLLAPH